MLKIMSHVLTNTIQAAEIVETGRRRGKQLDENWVRMRSYKSLQVVKTEARRVSGVQAAVGPVRGPCQGNQILFCSLKQLQVLGLPGAARKSYDYQELGLIFIKHHPYAKYCAWDFHVYCISVNPGNSSLGQDYNPLLLFRKQTWRNQVELTQLVRIWISLSLRSHCNSFSLL